MHLIYVLLIAMTWAQAETFPGGYQINPVHAFKTIESRTIGEAKTGFSYRGQTADVEVSVKGETYATPAAAQEFATLDFSNVSHLYSERGNPYQGQISQLVVCDPKLKPQHTIFKILNVTAKSLNGGANARKALGACNSDQVANWAQYFTVVDEKTRMVIIARLFTPVKSTQPAEIAAARKRLEAVASTLLVQSK